MKTTKIVCPKCGTEFEIPETSHIAVGIVIGKDSNLGTISPKVAEPKKKPTADERLEALRKAGIDTTGMYAVNGASSEGVIVKLKDGAVSTIKEDDPIFKNIINSGTIPEKNLFRRWVMSQMFHMFADGRGFNEALKGKGYNYQWKMVTEEFRVQAVLFKNDMENFTMRHLWFNESTLVKMFTDYINKLMLHVSSCTVRKCKGVPYIRLNGKDIFLTDVEKKYVAPVKALIEYLKIKNLTPSQVYTTVCEFNSIRVKLPNNTHQSNEWVSAYKGSGSYFTLKNLILFHGCGFYNGCVKMNNEQSLKKLDKYAEQFNKEGYKMFAVLKEFLSTNGIDIKAKIAEWAKKKGC